MNPLNMQEMLEKARQMQEQVQTKLNQTVVEASSGAGAVTVTDDTGKTATDTASVTYQYRPR